MEKEYGNLGFAFLLLPILAVTGFYTTYLSLYPIFNTRIDAVVHFHAAVLSLWIVLLVVQPLLVRFGKLKAHRSLGKCSYILVPLMIASFIAVISKEVHLNADLRHIPFAASIKRSIPSIAGMAVFSLAYIFAIVNRHKTSIHMRFMITTGLVIVPPALIRLLIFIFHVPPLISEVISFASIDVALLALILYDRIHKREYRPYVISLLLLFVSNALFVYSRIF